MKKKMLRSVCAVTAACMLLTGLTGCKSAAQRKLEEQQGNPKVPQIDFKVTMVTDTGGINDQSFNTASWQGLEELRDTTGTQVGYLESVQEADYASNLDKEVDAGSDIVWTMGFAMMSVAHDTALMNPDVVYGCIDVAYGDDTLDNLCGVVFRAEEPSFMVGYAAALTTETGKIGFVGGQHSDTISQFEYGYRAGAAYGGAELGKDIEVSVQYAESFSDAAKGKAIATKMYSNGCDIVFHAAGGVGTGVIEAAKEQDKWAIGVDMDQRYLAPDNVLTSALKRAGVATQQLSERMLNGEKIGGRDFTFGLTDDAVGIPDENPNLDPEVEAKTLALGDQIAAGELIPPVNEEQFTEFLKTLK